jgi:hypothetical protein
MSILLTNDRFISQRVSRRQQAVTDRSWRQETPKRSASRSKMAANKKITKMEKVKNKIPKKSQAIRKTVRSPHNTTQYIIDANNSCSEAQNLYMGQDRFSFDFQHHMSAGSMMDLMGSKFAQMLGNMLTSRDKMITKEEEPVNSVISCLNADSCL